MKTVLQIFLLILLLLPCMVVQAADPAEKDGSLAKKRQLFLQAKAAIEEGRYREYFRLKNKLKNYPLYPYLQFDYLRKKLNSGKHDDEARLFINKYKNHHLGERLRTSWLSSLARKKKWKQYVTFYRSQNSFRLQCQYAWALYQVGKNQIGDKQAKKLYSHGKSLHRSCNKVFEKLKARGKLSQDMIWARIVAAMRNNKVSFARILSRRLTGKSDKEWVKLWLAVHRNPNLVLIKSSLKKDSTVTREIVMHGVKRLARRDLVGAWNFWHKIKGSYKFTDKERRKVDRYIAMRAVYEDHPKALEWFGKLDEVDKSTAEWRVRLAIRKHDWQQVIVWVEEMKPKLRDDEQWRYWYARAHQLLGKQDNNQSFIDKAIEEYRKLAKVRNYYGFLAADHLGEDYELTLQPANFSEEGIKRMSKRLDVRRARELYFLDMRLDARREWRNVISDLNDQDLKLVSIIASRWGWHDRAILTFARIPLSYRSNVDFRFPVAYRNSIMQNAQRNEVDPAWVYGVVRQESAFMPDARSHVGAMGLMQLMPSTARIVSRATKTPLRRTKELMKPEKNIQLGSAYLRMLLDRTGSQVVATASYNAGPVRAIKWRPDEETIDADIWIESIPFNETRSYVSRVMAYTVIFDHLLDGRITLLKDRMPPITPHTPTK